MIGQNKKSLEPGTTNTFNFVITSPQPFTTTNLTARLSFTKIVLDGDKVVDIKSAVVVTIPAK